MKDNQPRPLLRYFYGYVKFSGEAKLSKEEIPKWPYPKTYEMRKEHSHCIVYGWDSADNRKNILISIYEPLYSILLQYYIIVFRAY